MTNLEVLAKEFGIDDPKEVPTKTKIGGNLALRAHVLKLAEEDADFRGHVRMLCYGNGLDYSLCFY